VTINVSGYSGPNSTISGSRIIASKITGSAFLGGTFQGTSFYETSTRELKKNIFPITNASEKIYQLQGVEFDWRTGSTQHQIGLIAEEVAQVFPEVLNDEGKAINYSKLVAALVEAFKEQNTEIQSLKKEVEKLKKLK
jgi:hypothetical protein